MYIYRKSYVIRFHGLHDYVKAKKITHNFFLDFSAQTKHTQQNNAYYNINFQYFGNHRGINGLNNFIIKFTTVTKILNSTK